MPAKVNAFRKLWSNDMRTEFVSEGQIKLEVPELAGFRTRTGDYAPSLTRVFYNPHMELCRDISISVAQVLADELGGLRICDPLAGVGVRGIRYAKEVSPSEVFINDRSREAFDLILRNVQLNGLASVRVFNEDANLLLWRERGRFNFIDIDPFGSPSPFIEAACAALAKNGILALTATDTAPLSGTHPRACIRRYGARPLRTEYHKELGMRILIGFCQRVAGKHELALKPLLAHSTRHYFRVYVRAQRGAKPTDEVLSQQGYLSHCNACGRVVFTRGLAAELRGTCDCGNPFVHAGPLWLGQLMDRVFTRKVAQDLARRDFRLLHQELLLLHLCSEEVDGPPFFYDVNGLSRLFRASAPKLDGLIAKLKQRGYWASRTHFSSTGIRTDAPLEEIREIFKRP